MAIIGANIMSVFRVAVLFATSPHLFVARNVSVHAILVAAYNTSANQCNNLRTCVPNLHQDKYHSRSDRNTEEPEISVTILQCRKFLEVHTKVSR